MQIPNLLEDYHDVEPHDVFSTAKSHRDNEDMLITYLPVLLEFVASGGDRAKRADKFVDKQADKLVQHVTRQTISSAKHTKNALKPAELYRKYADTLRQLGRSDVVNELYLASTLPGNDLESSYWLDSYTDEPIEVLEQHSSYDDSAEHTFITWGAVPVAEPESWFSELVKMKPYDSESMNELFVLASAEYVGGSVEDDIFDESMEREDAPVWMAMEEDHRISSEGFELVRLMGDLTQKAIGAIKERKHKAFTTGADPEKLPNKFWQLLIGRLTELAQFRLDDHQHLSGADLAAGFLAMQGKFNIQLNIADLMYREDGVDKPLVSFLDGHEDHILSQMIDSAPPFTFYTSDRVIDKVADKFFKDILSTIPKAADDTKSTRLWSEGYMRAVMEKTSSPNNSAWDFFRRSISPLGAQAYKLASSNKWSAFYRIAYRENALHDRIIGINKKGVQVANQYDTKGKHIGWRLAVIKYQNGEIDLDLTQRARLRAILKHHQFGAQLVKVL